jgi:hypothetical protein
MLQKSQKAEEVTRWGNRAIYGILWDGLTGKGLSETLLMFQISTKTLDLHLKNRYILVYPRD